MQNEYTVKAKTVANGKKIKYEILKDGQPFGDRTTGRVYTVALVATHSRAFAIQNAKSNIGFYKGPKGAAYSPEQRAQAIAGYEAKIALLESGAPDKNYDVEFVASWHSSRSTVRVPKYLT